MYNSRKSIWLLAILAVAFAGLFQSVEAAERVWVKPAYGGKLKFVLLKPDNPKAAVVLIPGGRGYLDLDSDGDIYKQKKSFLVVNREGFLDKGLMVAVFNPPEGIEDLQRVYRMSEKHGQDIQAVVEYLKKKANVPVWLIGHSRGTFSAANGAIRLGNLVSGLVLTSTITKSREKYEIYKTHPNAVLNMDLASIKVPTLVLANKPDSCASSPASNAEKVMKALTFSSAAAVKVYGDEDPCSDSLSGRVHIISPIFKTRLKSTSWRSYRQIPNSRFGLKQTLITSASYVRFGSKADINAGIEKCPLSGVKRTLQSKPTPSSASPFFRGNCCFGGGVIV